MDLVLGIDTSNYTTSLCAVSAKTGQLLGEARRLLPVRHGEKGLRQSDALFHHVQRLPQMMDELIADLRTKVGDAKLSWHAVGVSTRPRPLSTSYMPVFTAGQSFAECFGRALGIPVIHTSHQEGHIAAAEHFLDVPENEPFIAVHLSGGTSDVLYARRTRFGYAVTSVAEGADLHAGQFIDRVGVALGLSFPAGPQLEQLAKQAANDSTLRFTSSVRDGKMSFSGPCTAALRAISEGHPPADIALAVQACVASSVIKAINAARLRHPDATFCIIAGGVAANEWIRQRIVHRLRIERPDLKVYFAPVRYSSDNALGPATIAYRYCVTDLPSTRQSTCDK
jgi:N6-L-threonylcarbamoyladenine synthase